MNSGIDDFLDEIDQWKLKLHERLKGMNAAQRKAYWKKVHEEARQLGLPVVESEALAKTHVYKRRRRTG